jgi:hypothetical protein
MPNETKQGGQKNSGGFGAGFLVATAIFLAVLILAGLACGGWWYYKKYVKKTAQKIEQSAQSPAVTSVGSQGENLTYTNNQFGFSVTMTPAWKEYKVKEQTLGGDFEVGRIGFFLPTAQNDWESIDMPGYFNAFAISAYVKDSWDEALKAGGASMPMGEEIGRNSLYVFVWSHFNGEPPSDISAGTIRDMQTIVNGIQTFSPAGAAGGSAAPSSTAAISGSTGWETGTRPVRNADFDYDSVYYWNCKHKYTLNYPTAWSNNGMTYDSNIVILKGNKVQVWVEAVSIPASKTLQVFAEERAAQISGVRAWNEIVDWGNGVTVLRSTFTKPNSQALWWISSSGAGMELKTIGDGYDNSYTTIQNLIATLDPNSSYIGAKCGSTSTSEAAPKTNVKKDCSFPNGDIEYWWNSVSQDVRDCYISKYGYPNF